MTPDHSTFSYITAIDGSRIPVLVTFEVDNFRVHTIQVFLVSDDTEVSFHDLPLDDREEIKEACQKEVRNNK